MNRANESPAAGLRSSPHGVTSSRSNNQTSESWFAHNSSSSSNNNNVTAAPSGPARSNASHDWYKHDDGCGRQQPWPPGLDQLPPGKVHHQRRNDDAKRQMTSGHDPNAWYRHDHQPDEAPASSVVEPLRSGKKMHQSPEKEKSGGVCAAGVGSPHAGATGNGKAGDGGTLWFAHDARQGETADGDTSLESPRNRHTAPDADSYYQRDKTGSGADWFPHEHSANQATTSPPAQPSSGRQTGAARESDEIARRLKVESEDWYSHDASTAPPTDGGAASPTHGRLGVTPEVRRMIARDSGDDVRQILRGNENATSSGPQLSPR